MYYRGRGRRGRGRAGDMGAFAMYAGEPYGYPLAPQMEGVNLSAPTAFAYPPYPPPVPAQPPA
eukprot:scaffold48190_cov19-Tisochrysis_lutea.AAC.1